MRRNAIMLLAAALFVVAGCKKDDNNAGDGGKMTFTSYLGGGDAKTEIVNGKDMIWTAGDRIVINGQTFESEISEDGTFATFTGPIVEPPFHAYYPASIWNNGTPTLPAIQTYSGTNLSGVNPMYALSENTTLVFHNICALVKLDLTGTCKVASIEAKADQALSGTFDIAGDEANGWYAQLNSRDAAATVTLNCGEAGGVQLVETIPTTFYIALPKGDYTGLTFTVTDTDGNTFDVQQPGTAMLEAGKIWNKVAEVSAAPQHEYVNFGTPDLNWSTCNLGATNGTTPESWYGDYFAWGETETKTDYKLETYKYGSGDNLTKYNTDPEYGTVDDKTVLEPEDDAAHANWGDGWRMPTAAEWQELYDNNTFRWLGAGATDDATGFTAVAAGYLVVKGGKNDNAIDNGVYMFLPAAGFRYVDYLYFAGSDGYYWSSSLNTDSPNYALICQFGSGDCDVTDISRCCGLPVRAVRSARPK